jgi:hypothetical protein
MSDDLHLRFPNGRFQPPAEPLPAAARAALIDDIARLPDEFRAAAAALTAAQLDTPYRPDGWTGRQVIHHVPESHMNAFVRFKLALTEELPTIRPYDESAWTAMADARTAPPELSLSLVDALHARWVLVLRHMRDADFVRRYNHPDMGPVSLDKALALYSWHGKHHTAHLRLLST